MTYDEFLNIVFKVLDYIVWGLAFVGALTLTAFLGYLHYTPDPATAKKQLSDRCINSSCEDCPTRKPSRFVRHQGECK